MMDEGRKQNPEDIKVKEERKTETKKQKQIMERRDDGEDRERRKLRVGKNIGREGKFIPD